MRTQKTILNLVYALGSSLLLMLLGFATRRLLVFNFGNDITAASQVVDKLFNFFSIAEFCVGSVISYRLYEQIAAKDTEKISKYCPRASRFTHLRPSAMSLIFTAGGSCRRGIRGITPYSSAFSRSW